MDIRQLSEESKTYLYEMCTALFPAYKSMVLTRKGDIVFKLKHGGILNSIFPSKRRYRLIDFIFYNIPRQISIFGWNSLDLYRYYYTEMLKQKQLSVKHMNITLEDLADYIDYLHNETSKVQIMDIHNIDIIPSDDSNKPMLLSLTPFIVKTKKITAKFKRDLVDLNKVYRTFECYTNGIIKITQTKLAPILISLTLIVQLLRTPLLKSGLSVIDPKIFIFSSGTPAFFIT